MIIGDFARENAVFLELLHEDARVADDLLGLRFERFLLLGIAVHVVNTMLEGRGGDVMEETGEGLFLVAGEFPYDEGDTDAVLEDVVEAGKLIEGIVVDIDHADGAKTLHFGGGDIAEEPSWEIGGEDL